MPDPFLELVVLAEENKYLRVQGHRIYCKALGEPRGGL